MELLPASEAGETAEPDWSNFTITLRRVLEVPLLRDAAVDGSAVKASQNRHVRWASVLTHGQLDEARDLELVLTGSAIGGSAEGFRYQLGKLAQRDIAAVVLRLAEGETHLPGYVAAAAARVGLPIIAIESSASLPELAHSINRVITNDGTAARVVLERVDRQLHDVLAAGAGLAGLIEQASTIVEGPVALLTPLRRVVAASGFEPAADPRHLVTEDGARRVEVEILDRVWGLLCTGPPTEGLTLEHAAVVDTLPRLIAIEVLQFSEMMTADERIRREFLIDLLVGTVRSRREFTLRAACAGFSPDPNSQLMGLAMPLESAEETAVSETLGTAGARHLCAPLNQDLLVLVELVAPDTADGISELLVAGGRDDNQQAGPLVALGPPTDDHGNAGWTLNEARDTLTIARDLQMTSLVVKADSVAIERLFSRLVNDSDLHSLVDETLGDLLAHDESQRSPLVPTLDAVLDNGLNKAAAARALGIRRQTLHARVERIEDLVGPLNGRENRVALELALRMRRLLIDSSTPVSPRAMPR